MRPLVSHKKFLRNFEEANRLKKKSEEHHDNAAIQEKCGRKINAGVSRMLERSAREEGLKQIALARENRPFVCQAKRAAKRMLRKI
ncbi:MAG: hypothetical protein NTW59_05010 [Candidatus Diapherotrites archaeon]|nr:hypothetical protein [Candidatus Diapherotrites archaeon]